ncbi:cell surface A33 antigen [Elgaria multicarinata webbii]|uniref:cell surface A33 antigen n=1 Tax=Elgaria multicarinata webbii TaxID=159646 RepID=UPI002FCCEEF8
MLANKQAKLFILSAVVAAIYALTVETPQKKLEVNKGNNATLQCHFQTPVPNREIGDLAAWRKLPKREEFFSMRLDNGKEFINVAYQGRLSVSGNVNNGDVSITINQVTMDDNGTYECSVRLLEYPPMELANMDLLVLVPPSKPECKIIGKLEYGQNVNLTCNSIEGSPAPKYSWQSYDTQNHPRQLVGTQIAGGVLLLKNISIDTTGYYICLSENSAGQEKCNMSVAVKPPSMNFALYGGIIGGCVAFIIIIGIVAYCCCCRNSKDKEYEQTETENNYQPPHEPVRIRGPTEEEVPEEEDEHNGGNYSPQMQPARRPPATLSNAAV